MPRNEKKILDLLARLGQFGNRNDDLMPDHREDPFAINSIIDRGLKGDPFRISNEKLFKEPEIQLTKEFNYCIKNNNINNDLNIQKITKENIGNYNYNRLDDLYEDIYRQRDNDRYQGLFNNYINPDNDYNYDQVHLNHGVGGYLSQRLGEMFDASELEGIEVKLVQMSVEEEVALFDARTRFIDRTAEKISKAYKKETGLEINEEDLERVKVLVSLKMQDRQKVSTTDFITAICNGTIDTEIASLKDKQHFSNEQISNIETAARERGSIQSHAQLFQNGDRRYFRIDATGKGKTQKKVEEALLEMGYFVTDYEAGIATENAIERSGKQQFKIGKLLKENEGLLKEFSDDPLRGIKGLMVVMSRDPMDIARMSTNRGWRSCMSNDGINFRYVYQDIRQGTVVSYLTSIADPYVHDPLARVSLKPFTKTSASFEKASTHSEDDVIFRPGPNYGIPNAAFYRALQQFTKTEINAGKGGTFSMAEGLYRDGMKTRVTRSSLVA